MQGGVGLSKFSLSFFLFIFFDTVEKVLKALGVENQYVDDFFPHFSFFAMLSMSLFLFQEKKYKKENITEKEETFGNLVIIPLLILGLIARIIIWLG